VGREHVGPSFPEHGYIRRRGRMTKAQARAHEQWSPTDLIDAAHIAEHAGEHPIGIEIGFGMGQALLQWAAQEPDWRLYGIELYQPGIGSLMDGLHRENLRNVLVVEVPAQQVIAALPDASVQEVRIFFPDPWPKKRHHKRRLIQPEFVDQLARVLQADGVVRLATDWEPYAQWMRECFAAQPALAVIVDQVRAAGDPEGDDLGRAPTKFERRGQGLGHDIHDLAYARPGRATP